MPGPLLFMMILSVIFGFIVCITLTSTGLGIGACLGWGVIGMVIGFIAFGIFIFFARM